MGTLLAEDSSDICFQHVESLPSEENIATMFLQGWEQHYAISAKMNGKQRRTLESP